MKTRRRAGIVLLGLALVSLSGLFVGGCSSVPRRDPTGEVFPSVVGTSLDGDEVALPESVAGAPAVLLVGYLQDAQFDIDRWLLGLAQLEVDVQLYEVPTIQGMVPRMIGNTIDNGMRRGIPSEDWGSVVTVYRDAGPIVELTGNENGNNGRVLLLDAEGRVDWFWDRGYSATAVQALAQRIAEM